MDANKISGVLSDADKAAIIKAIDDIQAKTPFLKSLTDEERRALPKMGAKSRVFVKQCLEVARQNKAMLPAGFDVEEFARDIALYEALEPVALRVEKYAELLRDSLTAGGSDAVSSAFLVYNLAKIAGKAGNLDDNLDTLSQRFARRGRKAAPAETKA